MTPKKSDTIPLKINIVDHPFSLIRLHVGNRKIKLHPGRINLNNERQIDKSLPSKTTKDGPKSSFQSDFQQKMKKFLFVELFAILVVSTVFAADYDEVAARYKMWPMASAAYSSNPGLCVKDNFADAQVVNH